MTIERRRRSRVDASRVRINWIGELACRNSSSVTCARSVNGRCDPRDRSEGSLSYRKRIGEPWLVRIGPIPRPRCRAREKKSESHRPRRSTAIDAGSVCGFCERERECVLAYVATHPRRSGGAAHVAARSKRPRVALSQRAFDIRRTTQNGIYSSQ